MYLRNDPMIEEVLILEINQTALPGSFQRVEIQLSDALLPTLSPRIRIWGDGP
jgi:hypothetical protein